MTTYNNANTITILLCIAAILAIAAVICAILESRAEHKSFVTTNYTIQKSENSIRIIFLSDLHSCIYGRDNCELINAIRSEKPDLILIGGDMFTGKKGQKTIIAQSLVKQLPDIAPTYYALGNHENRARGNPKLKGIDFGAYQKELEKAGVVFLDNKNAQIQIKDKKISITGLTITPKTIKQEADAIKKAYLRASGSSTEAYHILLAHDPSYMTEYLKLNQKLILCGHLHGGIVRIPKIGGLISSKFRPFPKYSGGYYHKNDTDIIVSRGLGSHTIHFRLWNRPEMVGIMIN
ncbi:MAG: metallophosphoesterase [Lachnospiraceae bacterium]|jgi:predicted MPP superfamily phosphohydrolase|nr:metallophosphoesterase [Lachnospiraceae bacterium]